MPIPAYAQSSDAPRPWTASDVAAAKTRIDAVIANAPLDGSHLGVIAVDARTGAQLYRYHATDAFVPASTLKLVTGLTALHRFGSAARFSTRVVLDGRQSASTFRGDVVIVSDGDPELSTADLENAAAAIAARGITSIVGAIRVESRETDLAAYPPGWVVDDRAYDYGAPSVPLALDENVVALTVRPGTVQGAPAVLAFSAHDAAVLAGVPLAIGNRVITGSAGASDTADAYADTGFIGAAGVMPLGHAADALTIAVPDPARYVRASLQQALSEEGVSIRIAGGRVPSNRVEVWTHASKPLAVLLHDMWLHSDNLIAEMLFEHLGRVSGAGDERTRAATVETAFLRDLGIETAALSVSDGSGLSRYDLMTPQSLALLLRASWNGESRRVLLDGLPIAGVSGTLAARFRGTPLAGHFHAKTGGMTNVENLAGMLATPTHGWVSVVIMLDDSPMDDPDVHMMQQHILDALYR